MWKTKIGLYFIVLQLFSFSVVAMRSFSLSEMVASSEDDPLSSVALVNPIRNNPVNLYDVSTDSIAEDNDNSFFKLLSCGKCSQNCWYGIAFVWNELLSWNKSTSHVQDSYLSFLPSEILWRIASFLISIDILRLSGTCKQIRSVFGEVFWWNYLSKFPQRQSYLLLKGPLSPISNRKAFFSHLWYTEHLIKLAANLNHPEALIIRDYGSYGLTIDQDQYLCPSGIIRDISGRINTKKTECLKKAERKKAEAIHKKSKTQRNMQKIYNKYGYFPK